MPNQTPAVAVVYVPLIVAGTGVNVATPTPTLPALPTPTPVDRAAYQAEVIRLITTYRMDKGCPAAIEQPMLMTGTHTWNQTIVETTVIAHSPMGYYGQFGYDSTNQRQGPVEVIQVGGASPADAVQAWIDHAPHERLLRWCPLTGGTYEIGVSYLEPGYWVGAIGWWDAPTATPTASPTATATPTPTAAPETPTPTATPTAPATLTTAPPTPPPPILTPTPMPSAPPTPTATPVDAAAYQAELIRLINTYRAEQGCPVAREEPMLMAGTHAWNQTMVETGVLAHAPMGYDQQFGYEGTNNRHGPVELIRFDPGTPAEALRAWTAVSADERLLRWCPFAGGTDEIGVSYLEPGYWVAAIGWWDQ
ncbi:MAG TPA: hypothetical protein VFZ66_17250 [Herpetosiphonaceae bacterium]